MARNTENGNTANIDKMGESSPDLSNTITKSTQPEGMIPIYLAETLDTSQSVSQEADDTAVEHSKFMLH